MPWLYPAVQISAPVTPLSLKLIFQVRSVTFASETLLYIHHFLLNLPELSFVATETELASWSADVAFEERLRRLKHTSHHDVVCLSNAKSVFSPLISNLSRQLCILERGKFDQDRYTGNTYHLRTRRWISCPYEAKPF